MKIFISWSGETSRAIAEVLRKWLPSMLQSLQPYYSPDDIRKGSRWAEEISKELEESNIGILCITKEALHADWLLFEAGALSKNTNTAKVCPVLFGIEPTDVSGPLQIFQACKFEKGSIKSLLTEINKLQGQGRLTEDILDHSFEHWWPELEKNVAEMLDKGGKTGERHVRSERDILEEVLAILRTLSQTKMPPNTDLECFLELLRSLTSLATDANDVDCIDEYVLSGLEEIVGKTQSVVRDIARDPLLGGPVRQSFKNFANRVSAIRKRHDEMTPSQAADDDIPF